MAAGLAAGLSGGVAPVAQAQGTGLSQFLPPVPPLTMPSAPQRAGKGGKTAAPAAAPAGNAPVNKAILNGPVSMKLTVDGAVQRIMIVTNRPFAPVDQFTALDAARAVQRDLVISCGKLCKPAKMITPVIDANGHLSFDMAIQGFARQLTTADIMALLQATPLIKGETPAGGAAPAPATPAPAGVARPTPPAAPAVPVPPKPPAAAPAPQAQ